MEQAREPGFPVPNKSVSFAPSRPSPATNTTGYHADVTGTASSSLDGDLLGDWPLAGDHWNPRPKANQTEMSPLSGTQRGGARQAVTLPALEKQPNDKSFQALESVGPQHEKFDADGATESPFAGFQPVSLDGHQRSRFRPARVSAARRLSSSILDVYWRTVGSLSRHLSLRSRARVMALPLNSPTATNPATRDRASISCGWASPPMAETPGSAPAVYGGGGGSSEFGRSPRMSCQRTFSEMDPVALESAKSMMLDELDTSGAEGRVSRHAGKAGSPPTGGELKLSGPLKHFYARSFLLYPGSRFMRYWDATMIAVLLYVAIFLPFDVAFLGNHTHLSPIFVVTCIMDFYFFVDIIVNFFLSYYSERDHVWITSHRRIAGRYLRGWFLVDLISIMPVEVIALAFQSDSVSHVLLMRVVRLLKMSKLLRVLRAGGVLRRTESFLNINMRYNLIGLIKFVLLALGAMHWMACVWRLVAVIENLDYNWITAYAARDDPSGSLVNDLPAWEEYVMALYYTAATMITIGYGDVVPVTKWERMSAILFMLIGASVYAYIVGSVCGVISALNAKSNEYHQLMDDLNVFMRDHNLSRDLQQRLREFFKYRKLSDKLHSWQGLLSLISPSLKAEVAEQMYAAVLRRLEVFRDAPLAFITLLSSRLEAMTSPPNETIIHYGDEASHMYIIERGVVASQGALFVSGTVLGKDMLYAAVRRFYSARTLSFTDMFRCSREDMLTCLDKFPDLKESLRRTMMRHVFRQHVVAYAKAYRKVEHIRAMERRARQLGLSWAPHRRRLADVVGQNDLVKMYEAKLLMLRGVDLEDEQALNRSARVIQRGFRGYVQRSRAAREREEEEKRRASQASKFNLIMTRMDEMERKFGAQHAAASRLFVSLERKLEQALLLLSSSNITRAPASSAFRETTPSDLQEPVSSTSVENTSSACTPQKPEPLGVIPVANPGRDALDTTELSGERPTIDGLGQEPTSNPA